MAAMAADMMGALEFAAIGALVMGLGGKRLVAAAHAAARRGGFAFRNSHDSALSRLGRRNWRQYEPRRLAEGMGGGKTATGGMADRRGGMGGVGWARAGWAWDEAVDRSIQGAGARVDTAGRDFAGWNDRMGGRAVEGSDLEMYRKRCRLVPPRP
jgi:hypothetical protein